MWIGDDFGEYGTVQTDSNAFTVNQWLRIAITYSTISLQMEMSIDDQAPITTYADPSLSWMGSDGKLSDDVVTFILSGGAEIELPGFEGDMAGLLFIDEKLDSSTIADIQGLMVTSADLTLGCQV